MEMKPSHGPPIGFARTSDRPEQAGPSPRQNQWRLLFGRLIRAKRRVARAIAREGARHSPFARRRKRLTVWRNEQGLRGNPAATGWLTAAQFFCSSAIAAVAEPSNTCVI